MKTALTARITAILCEGLALLFFAWLCYLVLSQATNIPFWDEWGMASVFDKYYSGTLEPSYFLLGQTDHVLAIPQLVILLLGLNTHWDIRAELVVNLLLGLSMYLLYRSILLKDTQQAGRKNILLLPLVSMLLFSFIQWHNWTWGWQIQTFLSTLACLATLAILSLKDMTVKNVAAAALCAVIANLSFASGTQLWLIGALLIALRANKLNLYLIWAIPACLCLYLYYVIKPDDLVLSQVNFSNSLKYILTYLGSPLSLWSWGTEVSYYFGLFGICLPILLLFIIRKFEGPALFFLTVIAFVLMVAAITSIARPHDFYDEATASRYSNFPVHYWIAVICLLFYRARPQHALIKISQYLVILVIAGLSLFVSYQNIHYFYIKDERTMIINYYIHPERVVESEINFRAVIWNRGELNRKTRLLQKHQLGFYAPNYD
jgi:hypothetical protein